MPGNFGKSSHSENSLIQYTSLYIITLLTSKNMDIQSSASGLRNQLIVLDTANKQMELLGDEISTVSQQTFLSTLEGNSARNLQLSLRLSVLEGVQQVYKQVADRKWNQVQSTARSILSELQPDTDNTQVPTTLSTQTVTSTDKTAAIWSRDFCDFYRDN